MTKKAVKCWLCKRFLEPSTWSGFGVVVGTSLAGIQLAAALPAPYSAYAIIAVCIGALCGFMAIILPEGRK